MSSDIMVIPDTHFQPGTDHSRASWLGNLAVRKQPDKIVMLGDWCEMGSLSMYDVGKVSSEGKRYQADIEAANEALELFHTEIDRYNSNQKSLKKKQYKPELHMLLGNHENRIEKARQENPKFYDSISIDDIDFKRRGWEVYGMTSGVTLERIKFQHYATSGVMGRAIGGANHCRNLLLKNHMSTVVGHSHLLDLSTDIDAEGNSMFAICAGCCFDYDMDWTSENNRYWRGVTYLHECNNGTCYPEFIGINKLKEKYGTV